MCIRDSPSISAGAASSISLRHCRTCNVRNPCFAQASFSASWFWCAKNERERFPRIQTLHVRGFSLGKGVGGTFGCSPHKRRAIPYGSLLNPFPKRKWKSSLSSPFSEDSNVFVEAAEKGEEKSTVIMFFKKYFLLLIFKERGKGRLRERQRNTDLSFHLFMHSLVDSCMCPDQDWTRNLGVTGQPWL